MTPTITSPAGTHAVERRFPPRLEQCDAIITPTAPTPAFRIGEKVDDPLAMYLNDIYTVTANLAGIPGMSVPLRIVCDWTTDRLSAAWAILVRTGAFRLGHAYEQAQPFTARPSVYVGTSEN
jgi:aspartyl-tRNA(Asn)/glutamyl-tRNA(Gln) amidotransferase subunit A